MSTASNWMAAAVGLVLTIAACSSESSPLTLDEYTTALQEVENAFAAAAPDDPDSLYPIDNELTLIGIYYMELDERLNGWRSLVPPPSLRTEHDELVDALDELQGLVGEYIREMAGDDIEITDVGRRFGSIIATTEAACRRLDAAIRELGAAVEFAGDDCTF